MTRGVTLLELLVVMAIVGLAAGIAGLAVAGAFGPHDTARSLFIEARTRAALEGVPVRVLHEPDSNGGPRPVLFLPDGRAVGRGVDPLTGRPAP